MSEFNDECSVFVTSRGGVKLFKNGFTYEKSKQSNNNYHWSCELRRNKIYNCTATVSTKLCDSIHKVLKCQDNHNHEPDPTRKCVSEFKEKLKSDSLSGVKTCKVLQNAKSTVSTDVLECLPSTSALKQVIYRHKRKQNAVKEPTDITFEIDSTYTNIKNENFIIKDHTFDTNKRILLMSTLSMMSILSRATYWLLDGTFKAAPNVFKQLYTIHGNICTDNKKTFPLCFCLCTNKDKRTYDTMFELLIEYGKEHGIDLAPKVCVLDFEKAAILSLRSNFEGIHLQGCHFHLGQIIYRQVQDQGFAKRYASDIQFNKEVKCLLALSFLEESEIYVYFNSIVKSFKDPDWQQLAHWFEKNYVHGTSTTEPEFQPRFWSCYETNKMNIPRTQNSAEAWHNKINNIIDKSHPGVYELMKQLIKETIANEREIENILTGAPPPEPKKKKYLHKEERINRILEHKSSYSEEKLLMCIAANLMC